MLIVTHEVNFARDISDTVVFMNEGVIEESGPPEEVFAAGNNTRLARFIEG